MAFPRTRHEMKRAYYTFKAARNCKSCGAAIQWWLTPNGKSIPIDAAKPHTDDTPIEVHWATCSNAAKHRKDAQKPQNPAQLAPQQARKPLARQDGQQALEELAKAFHARVVVAVFDDAPLAFAYRLDIPAEDLRHDLITAANRVRNHRLERL